MIALRELRIAEVKRLYKGYTHIELLRLITEYRLLFYSLRAYKGWQTRDRKKIEELKKVIPPYNFLRVSITFTIETGTGHELFYAEVTCDTVIPRTEEVASDRIINAVIKLFWIMFDIQKALLDIEWLKDKDPKTYDKIVKRKEFFQKYATEIFEYAMDNLLRAIIKLGGIERSKDEYVTKQAIIKIGVEYFPAPDEAEPKYPKVHVLIEKGTSAETKGEWTIEKDLLIADKTTIDMLKILDMVYEHEGKAA